MRDGTQIEDNSMALIFQLLVIHNTNQIILMIIQMEFHIVNMDFVWAMSHYMNNHCRLNSHNVQSNLIDFSLIR